MLELLIAIGIFVISLAAGIFLFSGGESFSIDSANAGLATDYAREGLDALRTIRNRNWTELPEGTHGLAFNGSEWLMSSSSSDGKDIFTRQVTISKAENDDNIKIATTAVSWQTGGRVQTLAFVEHFANWEEPSQSSCKTEPLVGNWANPATVATADLGAGNEGTDVVARLPYVYMSGEAASAAKPDVFVFDVTIITAPTLISSLNIGSDGIKTLFLKDNYLYAASGNNSKEFIVFDVSNPSSITEAASLNLAGTADGLSVTVYGNVAVVGRKDDADNELAFIDVANPSSPSVFLELASTNNGSVYDLTYTNEYLYATNGQGSNADVMIYDIRIPSSPVYATTYDIPGTSTEELSIYTLIKGGGTHLLVGVQEDELIALGATSTSGIYVRDRLNVGGDVADIVCVLGNLAFLASNNSGKEFTVVNINDINNIYEYASLNYPQSATGIDFDNNYVFMSVRSNDALRIITSQ